MRILFLAFRDALNPYVGGGDIYINELAKGCAKRGHDVTLLSSRFQESSSEEVVDNVRIVRLGSGFTMFLKVFAYYFLHVRGQIDTVVEEIMGGPRIPFFASFYMNERIVGILQQRHAEIFRQQFSLPIAFFLSFVEHLLVALYRGKQLIVNSSRTKEDLRAIGYDDRNMHVVYPGLPAHYFRLHNEDFSSRSSRVICLAKLRRYKLIDQAVQAMKNVSEVLPDCELIIAGRTNEFEPEYENELRRLVAQLDLATKVHFELNVSESRKIDLLRSSCVIVLPSAIEGFGTTVIEANAFGTPAITSDRVPAAVDGYNAMVVQCFDIDSLSKAIVTLVSDRKVWEELSVNSSKWASRYTWDASVDQFAMFIERGKQGSAV